MAKNENRVQFYVRCPIPNVEAFDKCLLRLGYKSRAEIIHAFIYALLEMETERQNELVFTVAKNLRGNQTNKLHLSETQIKRKLREIIGQMLMPVIAHKGLDIAFDVGCSDVRESFFDKYGLLLTDNEIHEGFCQYDLLNKSMLREYNLKKATEKEETNND